jgi:hypothetical protein
MFDMVLDAIATNPQVALVFSILGTLLCVATVIDSLIDDSIDGGFSKKLLEIPYIGFVLKSLIRFSVLRNKK